MNERVGATDAVLVAVPSQQIDALVSDYLELLGGEPSVIRDLVIAGVVDCGLRGMRERHSVEANKRYSARMGWPVEEEDET